MRNVKRLVSLSSDLYAHSLSGHPIEEWQRLDEHLNNVAKLAAQFGRDFDSCEWGWNAGILHDLGKMARDFQAYMRRENDLDDGDYDGVGSGRGHHSSAGGALAEQHFGLPGRILAYIIAGHHAGLPDYHVCDGGMGALEKRLEEGRANLEQLGTEMEKFFAALKPLLKMPKFVKPNNFHHWVRMLFSCLVDADRLDTAKITNPEDGQYRGKNITMGQLKDILDYYMTDLISRSDDTPLNRARCEVLDSCRVAAEGKPGLFSLKVPTGGGKTLSSMAFALDHAIKYDKKRIIYVIPYTSIIEQTASTLNEVFGPDIVIEHHSNLAPEKETIRSRLASENWDGSIVVTTNVQFFESLYSAHPSRCRKIHNIIKSVVILDEAQLVPPNLLSPCVAIINELTLNYGVTVLLSTATQPPLPKLRQPNEIITETARLYERLQRTAIYIPKSLNARSSWEEISEKLQEHDSVLCIVNTRRDCYDLYRLMPSGTIHLSAAMCGEHRSHVIDRIKERLKEQKPIRVISTQLVEAGVDIDFPVVYRALTGLDSIVQAAGRCNREGRLRDGMGKKTKGKVIVFVPPKSSPPGLLLKGESTAKELGSLPEFNPQSSNCITRYFELFYSKLNDTGEGFLKQLTPSDSRILDVAFRSTGDKFRLIDEQGRRPVFVRYERGQNLIEELRSNGPSRGLLRKLQRYTVNISLYQAQKMVEIGLLEEVWPGFLAQSGFNIYREDIGLDIFREGIPLEDIIGI